jgi:hypothetical protein
MTTCYASVVTLSGYKALLSLKQRLVTCQTSDCFSRPTRVLRDLAAERMAN